MNHLGLFEGIGGFSLAARWAGWETVAWCEIDPFCQKVLKHHFPEATGHTDIKTTDFTQYANKIDIITGGFPCQPYSMAGKRKGKEDDRHLWPEMLRAIREVKPRWVVGENVYGLVNWNGGIVFDEVQSDLEAEGYEVWTVILPAASVNAPHRRDRIWIIAYRKKSGKHGKHGSNIKKERKDRDRYGKFNCISKFRNVTNPESDGQQRFDSDHEINTSERGFDALNDVEPTICGKEGTDTNTNKIGLCGQEQIGKMGWFGLGGNSKGNIRNNWENFPTEPPVCGGDDGLPNRLDGITFPKWRNESIKAYGNAIVPQVAYELFKVINQIEQTK